MKLVEILARELKEWPEGVKYLEQIKSGEVYEWDGSSHCFGSFEVACDFDEGFVTRTQWEAERARIALEKVNEVAKKDAEDHAWMDDQKNAARISAEMAWEASKSSGATCGKRSKEDQALWDKVAISQMQALTVDGSYDFVRDYSDMYEESDMRKVIAATACDFADAFMAERAKRMK